MRDRLTVAAKRGAGTFNGFTAGQKAVTVGLVIALAVGGYFFSVWAATPTYAPLFSNLAATDASAIVEKLNAEGVKYELADGGATIMVPKDKVYDLRIRMSGEGLPAAGDAGYALLDKQGVMTSEFMQQVGYRRALEGELAKTIKAIDGVTGATVHLALPAKDVFSDDQKKTTASVLVATNPTKTLSPDRVQSIVHLVSSSVEGLEPEHVTVIGANGRVLSSSDSSSGTGAGSDARATQTTSYEQRLNSSLQAMLEQVLGPGKAVVNVTADLDFDATETKTQKYVSDPTVPPVAEKKETETYTGSGTPVGGVLGPDNIQVPGGNGGTGNYEKSTETRNNSVGTVTEVRKSAPGAVRKLSVAVIVDSGAAKIDETQLQQLVSSAIGLDAQRGDTIAVSSMAFDTSAAEAAKTALTDEAKVDKGEQLKSWIETGAIALAVLVLLVMAIFAGRRGRKDKRTKLSAEETEQLEEMQAAIETARQRLALGDGTGGNAAAIEAGMPAAPTTADIERNSRQREIATLVERQPDEVAQLLRGWLADRRG
jgi:flagellar M-ring protein FliF